MLVNLNIRCQGIIVRSELMMMTTNCIYWCSSQLAVICNLTLIVWLIAVVDAQDIAAVELRITTDVTASSSTTDANFPFPIFPVVEFFDASGGRITSGSDASLTVSVVAFDSFSGHALPVGVCPDAVSLQAASGRAKFWGAVCEPAANIALNFSAISSISGMTIFDTTSTFLVTDTYEVGFLIPMTGIWGWAGGILDAIMYIAEKDLSDGYSFWGDLLSNRKLSITHKDTASKSIIGIVRSLELIESTRMRALLGPAVDNTAVIVSQVATALKLPQIALFADAQTLSDKTLYPYFSRIYRSSESEYVAIAKVIANYGWNKIGIISAVPFPVPREFYIWTKTFSLDITSEVTVPTLTGEEDVTKQLEVIRDSGSRVILCTLEDISIFSNVYLQAISMGLGNLDGYHWIVPTYVAGSVSQDNEYPLNGDCKTLKPYPCTVEFRGFTCVVQLMGDPVNDPGGLWRDLLTKFLILDHRLYGGEYVFPSNALIPFLGIPYDALAMLARALDSLVNDNVSITPEILTKRIRETTHEGLTGPVILSNTGDRTGFTALIIEIQTLDERPSPVKSPFLTTSVLVQMTTDSPLIEVPMEKRLWNHRAVYTNRIFFVADPVTNAISFPSERVPLPWTCSSGCGGGLKNITLPYAPGQCSVLSFYSRLPVAITAAITAKVIEQYADALTAEITAQMTAQLGLDIPAEFEEALTDQVAAEFPSGLTAIVEAQFGSQLAANLGVGDADTITACAADGSNASSDDCKNLITPTLAIFAACTAPITGTGLPDATCEGTVAPTLPSIIACGPAGETITSTGCLALIAAQFKPDGVIINCGADGSTATTSACINIIIPKIAVGIACIGVISDPNSTPTQACNDIVLPLLSVIQACGIDGETVTEPACAFQIGPFLLQDILPAIYASSIADFPLAMAAELQVQVGKRITERLTSNDLAIRNSTAVACGADGSLGSSLECLILIIPETNLIGVCPNILELVTGQTQNASTTCIDFFTPKFPTVQACGALAETLPTLDCLKKIGQYLPPSLQALVDKLRNDEPITPSDIEVDGLPFSPWALLCGVSGSHIFSDFCMRMAQPLCALHAPEHEFVNGLCVDKDECVCIDEVGQVGVKAWRGSSCEEAQCVIPCKNGFCITPDVCSCDPGWVGLGCDEPVCDPVCTPEQGVCTGNLFASPGVTGTLANGCSCISGFYHGGIGKPKTCSESCECSVEGTELDRSGIVTCGVEDGSCTCKEEYQGVHCESKKPNVALIGGISAVAAMVIIVLLVMIGRYYVQQAKIRAELANTDWRLYYDEIKIFEGLAGFNSRIASGVRSGVRSVKSVRSAKRSAKEPGDNLSQNNQGVQHYNIMDITPVKHSTVKKPDDAVVVPQQEEDAPAQKMTKALSKAGSLGGSMDQTFCTLGIVNGLRVALKTIDRAESVPLNIGLRREMRSLRDTQHANIVLFVGAVLEAPHVSLVTEYAGKGSLMDVLAKEEISLDWDFKFSLARDIATGMDFIHKQSKVGSHGNLKSSNCLIDDRWVIKITDFGVPSIRVPDDPLENTYKAYASMLWIAPELLRGQDESGVQLTYYLEVGAGTTTGDVYSFGIVLGELITRQLPYSEIAKEPSEIVAMIESEGIRPALPDSIKTEKPQFLDLINSCLDKSESRPSFSSIISTIRVLNPKAGSLVDNMLKMLEKYTSGLEELISERTEQLAIEMAKAESLLYSMLPVKIAKELAVGNVVTAESFDSCTIFFSDVVRFNKISARSSPLQIVDFLNSIYSVFDDILEDHEVYKVETIADSYMVVSGIPERNGHRHAGEITNMALDLMAAMVNYAVPHIRDEKCFLRIGIHSGPAVAGVVGLKMPRYCLFGDTVNTSSRMMSGGLAWRIHISPYTYPLLQEIGGYILEHRGEIAVKGKGVISTYWVQGREGWDKQLPDVSLAPSIEEHYIK